MTSLWLEGENFDVSLLDISVIIRLNYLTFSQSAPSIYMQGTVTHYFLFHIIEQIISFNSMCHIHKMNIQFWRYSNFAERAIKPVHFFLSFFFLQATSLTGYSVLPVVPWIDENE